MSLTTPLSQAIQTTDKHLKQLEKLGVTTVRDLLLYFPKKLEQMEHVEHLSSAANGAKNTVVATLSAVQMQTARTGRKLYKAIATLPSREKMHCVWFNKAPYNLRTLRESQTVHLVGKVEYTFGRWQIIAPEIHEQDNVHTEGLRVIYPESGGNLITSRWLRSKIGDIIHHADELHDSVPEFIRRTESYYSLGHSVRALHRPNSAETWHKARASVGFAELFLLQVRVMLARSQRASTRVNHYHVPLNIASVKEGLSRLPYTLTHAQKAVLHDILLDFDKPAPSKRMVQGDVGSGKTVVAFLAAEQILSADAQVALLSPTEILTRQHYEKALQHFEPLGIPVELLIGSISEKEKKRVRTGLANGSIRMVIGTHALLTDTTEFKELGLGIIDEQHRFGVRQRAVLENTGAHIVALSATPIPRSLALTMYGEQDISVINELPPGRKPAITKVLSNPQKIQQMYLFIDDQITKGHQVFWVCPLIEESESESLADIKFVEGEYERLSLEVYPNRRIGLLHGKMKSADKAAIMADFVAGTYDILVSTSVIEVGVDVPNATVMVIENSERFGLSQLHQFRGRIGRSDLQSYCLLMVGKKHQTDIPRLQAMESSTDGMYLATLDMKLRGIGQLYGTKQSGMPDFKCADILDTPLVQKARNYAVDIVSNDPQLEEYPALLTHVAQQEVFF